MTDHRIRRVLILGSSVAAWLTALRLSKIMHERGSVCVVDAPSSAGQSDAFMHSESSLPSLKAMHRSLGIDERAFMRATHATFNLGTELRGWSGPDASYFHPLGELGAALGGIAFHHHWLRVFRDSTDLAAFSLNAVAARLGRFVHPSPDPRSVLSTLDYGYHFDPTLYRGWLRSLAEHQGVRRVSSEVDSVQLRASDDFIEALALTNGERLEADLFIDCSEEQASLIEKALSTGFDDWSGLLPCDRAVSVESAGVADPVPYTSMTACQAGWQWRIPLQHRTSGGYVYCSRFISDDQAAADLLSMLSEPSQRHPRVHGFVNGRRKKFWNRNCIAIGAAAGYLEPLASTHLHLISSGISRLAALFPHKDRMTSESDEYNRLLAEDYERVRDMLIAHYRAANPMTSPFWESCRHAEMPAPLAHKLRLFRSRGRVVLYDEETFAEPHWASVLLGLGIRPAHADPLAQTLPLEHVKQQLQRMHAAIERAAQAMPSHAKIIQHHCAADVSQGETGKTPT